MQPPRHNNDHSRYPPTHTGYSSSSGPPRPASSSSLFHHLPPPVPSTNSPLNTAFGSPNFRDGPLHPPSGGHTDPQGWAGGGAMSLDKPGSSRSRSGWNVSGLSPRTGDHGQRLPSLHDLPTGRRPSSWDAPSPNSHSSNLPGSSRGGFPFSSSSVFRFSPPRPPPLVTPMSSSGSADFLHASRGPGRESPETVRPSLSRGDSSYQRRISTPADSARHPPPTSGSDGASQKKKKRRVALSCAECAKRKQKCNRENPCQHCVARRVPELCVPYTRPGSPQSRNVKSESREQAAVSVKASPTKKEGIHPTTTQEAPPASTVRPASMLPTISVRVSRLEQLLNAMVNRVDGLEGKALNDWRINHPPATSPPPLSVTHSKRLTVLDRDTGEPPDTASTRSRRRENSTEWMEDAGETEEAVAGGLDRDTSGRNPLPQSMLHSTGPIPLGLDYHGTPAEQLQKLFEDCGVSPHKIQELMSDLPPREFAEPLIEWFFQKVNYVRYPIDEYLFKQAFDAVYAEGTNVSSVIALPLVFIVLALAIRVSPDDLIGPEDRKRTMSLRMYWSSKTAVIMASAVKAENLQLVETRILTGLYLVLMHERRLAEGWAEFRSALTIGQAIGLHRDGTKLRLDPYITEYRRRLWSYLIHADATYSCLLGRPTSINPACADTHSPSNICLSDLLEDKNAKAKPLSEPTFATYLILRERLGRIVAKVTQQFQSLQGEAQYRDIETLDAEFKQFVADLPPAFQMHAPDKSHDSELWWLVVHRYYIQTEVLHFTIILHRPWLLRKLRSQKYALSRTACFDAALTDYKLRQVFKQDCPDFFETLFGGSFREFNAAMIAGISIIIDPRSSQASDMKQIVQSFMQQCPHDPKADNFSQKEAAIIHTLWRRAVEMEEKRTRRQSIRMPRDNTSFERGAPLPAQTKPAAIERASSSTETITGTPSSSLTAQSYSRAGSLSHGGLLETASNSGTNTSSEDDRPQRLLDHWLVSNTSFGPGADSTINPYTGVLPTSYTMSPLQSGVINTATSAAGMYFDTTQSVNVPGGGPGWMDPSITTGEPVFGMGLGDPGSNLANPASGGGLGGGFVIGDGNSAQYWNALIDGIVGGLPAYDPTLHRGPGSV